MSNEVTIDPVSPGEILDEEFLRPLGISPHRLPEDIDVSPQEITEIVHGTRRISTDTVRRLAQHFGNLGAVLPQPAEPLRLRSRKPAMTNATWRLLLCPGGAIGDE